MKDESQQQVPPEYNRNLYAFVDSGELPPPSQPGKEEDIDPLAFGTRCSEWVLRAKKYKKELDVMSEEIIHLKERNLLGDIGMRGLEAELAALKSKPSEEEIENAFVKWHLSIKDTTPFIIWQAAIQWLSSYKQKISQDK